MALERIWVVPHPRAGNTVALWERDPEHPLNEFDQHEVYVAHGVGPQEVALTSAVLERLNPVDGTLVRLDGDLLEAAHEAHEAHLDRVAAAREQALAEQRQEETRRIREAGSATLELHERVVDLQRQLAAALEVKSAQDAAEQSRVQAEQQVNQAQARVEQARQQSPTADEGPTASEATTATSPTRAEAAPAAPRAHAEQPAAEHQATSTPGAGRTGGGEGGTTAPAQAPARPRR